MAVYVDDMHLYQMGRYGRMRMSHMMADSTDELLAMADRIGVARRWLQRPGTPSEHFDISLTKRVLAVDAGAKEITMRGMALMQRNRRAATREEQTHDRTQADPPEATSDQAR